MNYRKIAILCAFLLSVLSGEVNAHERDIIFRTLSVNDGLIQSAVNVIEEDAFGFMWFGTREGVSRYDGLSFTNYYFDPSDSTSINGNNIMTIMPEPDGKIWFGSNSGISIYDPFTGKFKRLPFDYRHVNYNKINKLVRVNNQFVFIGTENGLKIYDTSIEEFVDDPPGDLNQLKHYSIIDIYKDQEGNWWVATGGGLFLFNKLLNIKQYFNVKELVGNEIAYPISVFDFSDRYVTVGTNFGILVYNKRAEKLHKGEEVFEQLRDIDLESVHDMDKDLKGNVWFAGEKFFEYNSADDTFYFFENNKSDNSSEIFTSARTIKINSTGILWVGTYGFGLRIYDPNKFHIGHISADIESSPRLDRPYVLSIYTKNDTLVYVATEGGLNEINLVTSTSVFRPIKSIENHEIRVNSITPIGDEYLILGTDNGIIKIKIDGFEVVDHILQGIYISWMAREKDNTVWVSTQQFGVMKLNSDDFKIKQKYLQLNPLTTNNNGHSFNTVLPMDSIVWIGSEQGLFYINKKNNKVVRWKGINNKMIYDDLNVKSIYMDSKKRLWIGTWGMGLFKYDSKNKTFKRYGVKEGLPNSTIYGIVEDSDNNLWMSSNKGIIKFNPETEIFTSFYNLDNLQSFEFNTGAFYKSNNGVLYFGGINGLNIINPENFKSYYHPINTYITKLTVNHGILEGFLFGEKLKKNKKITLATNENSIEVEYIGLDFS
ncbi:MAG: hypothetical protein OEY34_08140, partial [Cyclobacteriaceae bacterium]|nr:hypothetical protein [Cyclobacteriaceae bacterium]